MKSNYDAAIKPNHFEVGSYVLVYTLPKQQSHVYGKWKVAWQGPFRVMNRLNATNYIVKRSHKAKDLIVHGDRLCEYYGEVDSTAWPAAKGNSQQAASADLDTSADDLVPTGRMTDRTHDATPAQPPPTQSDSKLPRGRRPRPGQGDQTSVQQASDTEGASAVPVSMPARINYHNECHLGNFGPINDTGSRVQPPRHRRRPARYLTAI